MAEANTEKKTRGSRKGQVKNAKPFYAILTYRDEQGNAVQLDPARLEIRTTKDPAELVKLFTGNYDGTQTVVTIEPPKSERPSPVADAA